MARRTTGATSRSPRSRCATSCSPPGDGARSTLGAEHAAALAQVALGRDAVRSCGHRGGVRLGRHRARHRPPARRTGRRRQARDRCRCCSPTTTSTGRRTPDRARSPQRRAGCSSPPDPGSGSTRSRTADVVLVPGLAVSPTGDAPRARRRVLRPGAGAGAGRDAAWRSCSTTTRSASTCPPSPTTWRSGYALTGAGSWSCLRAPSEVSPPASAPAGPRPPPRRPRG